MSRRWRDPASRWREHPDVKTSMIYIECNGDEIAAALGEYASETPRTMKNVLNSTARKTRTMLVRKARQEYVIKAKVLRGENDLDFQPATLSKQEAMLQIKRAMNELIDFKTRPDKPTKTGPGRKVDARAAVKKGGLKPMRAGRHGAFVTQFESGHVTMVQRSEKGEQYSAKNKSNRAYRRKRGGVGYYDLTKIVVYQSPSAAALLGKTYAEIEPAVRQLMQERMAAEIARTIARKTR